MALLLISRCTVKSIKTSVLRKIKGKCIIINFLFLLKSCGVVVVRVTDLKVKGLKPGPTILLCFSLLT